LASQLLLLAISKEKAQSDFLFLSFLSAYMMCLGISVLKKKKKVVITIFPAFENMNVTN